MSKKIKQIKKDKNKIIIEIEPYKPRLKDTIGGNLPYISDDKKKKESKNKCRKKIEQED